MKTTNADVFLLLLLSLSSALASAKYPLAVYLLIPVLQPFYYGPFGNLSANLGHSLTTLALFSISCFVPDFFVSLLSEIVATRQANHFRVATLKHSFSANEVDWSLYEKSLLFARLWATLFPSIVFNSCVICLSFTFSFIRDWLLSLLSLGGLLLILISLMACELAAFKIRNQYNSRKEQLWFVFFEALTKIQTLLSLGAEKHFALRFEDMVKPVEKLESIHTIFTLCCKCV
ncbi:hypothetical protein Ciccas_014168 [Cichlidogyrus casuarinus]|uniref:ABC transmembrane type-1 domain-containing protein n=1 Tax=Cichlidogyrus casuarinus TaxID=1844966 RepID=A0ABD2PK58_9PLAT